MDVAIRGDRAGCLTMQLAEHTWLFAVAAGFGRIDGQPTAPAALARVRSEGERRVRGERFRRAIDRPAAASNALLSILARVNADLFVRSAAHADYVTAGCSMTAVLVVRGRGYVVHAGGTAAYLAQGGRVRALTADDSFEDVPRPLLARALGTSPNLDVCVSNFALQPGDVVVLVAHRVQGDIDRERLIAHVERAAASEHLLVVRFDDTDRDERAAPAIFHGRVRLGVTRWLIRCAATLAMLALASTGWLR